MIEKTLILTLLLFITYIFISLFSDVECLNSGGSFNQDSLFSSCELEGGNYGE